MDPGNCLNLFDLSVIRRVSTRINESLGRVACHSCQMIREAENSLGHAEQTGEDVRHELFAFCVSACVTLSLHHFIIILQNCCVSVGAGMHFMTPKQNLPSRDDTCLLKVTYSAPQPFDLQEEPAQSLKRLSHSMVCVSTPRVGKPVYFPCFSKSFLGFSSLLDILARKALGHCTLELIHLRPFECFQGSENASRPSLESHSRCSLLHQRSCSGKQCQHIHHFLKCK